jgi:hypothetical protein
VNQQAYPGNRVKTHKKGLRLDDGQVPSWEENDLSIENGVRLKGFVPLRFARRFPDEATSSGRGLIAVFSTARISL